MLYPPGMLLLLACVHSAAPPDPPQAPALNPDAVAGVTDPALRLLLHDHWESAMARSPVWASALGDHRFDDQLGESGPAATAEDLALERGWLARAEAIPESGLNAEDRRTRALFLRGRQDEVATMTACRFADWTFSPRDNPLGLISDLPRLHPLDAPAGAESFLARIRALPGWIDGEIASLRQGLAAGLVNNAETTRLTIEMLDRELALPWEERALHAQLAEATSGWPEAERAALLAATQGQSAEAVDPALRRYRDLLRDEILPRARGADASGLAHMPGLEGCYTTQILNHTTLSWDGGALHAIGRGEVERLQAELVALGEETLGERDLARILQRLRDDPALHFASREEILARAEDSLARAQEAIPAWFGRLPQAPCVVTEIPAFEAPYTTIAYYYPPQPGGEKPGEYFVNTYDPASRPRFEAEALAWHEAVPGHHLQIAIAQELPEMPAFRRYMGMTAFVEGWALYAEHLAVEMGLYTSDTDHLGRLSFALWRASRLVVDTGIHQLGWSRQQAIDYMLQNTPLAQNNIENEVDRYISWPGQALAYKAGELTILRLRADAEAALGERFDVRAFHDVVLGGGAVSLPELETAVDAWVAAQ